MASRGRCVHCGQNGCDCGMSHSIEQRDNIVQRQPQNGEIYDTRRSHEDRLWCHDERCQNAHCAEYVKKKNNPECSACYGKGHHPWYDNKTCLVCNGKGYKDQSK